MEMALLGPLVPLVYCLQFWITHQSVDRELGELCQSTICKERPLQLKIYQA